MRDCTAITESAIAALGVTFTLAEATKGRQLTASERDLLRERLGQEKYQRLLQELLVSLRERTTVRVLDPLDEGQVAEKGR